MKTSNKNQLEYTLKLPSTGVFLICFFLVSCQHTASIRTTPAQAEVFAVDEKGNRIESLGKTPLQTSNMSTLARSLEIELPGFLPSQILLPAGPPKSIELDIQLREFNKKALDSLSPELYQGAVDKVMQELLAFQQTIFSSTPEEATAEIESRSKTLDGVASFHYILGSYHFFGGRFDLAVKSFVKALSLNPNHEQAKRMAILTDVKVANQTQAVRSKAFLSLQAAATEVATLTDGFLVRTKSKEWLTDFDGFEMILASDTVFRPGSAKLEKAGQAMLGKFAGELKRNESPRSITVEAHTDSDMSGEFTKGSGAVLRGRPAFKSVWELSSARAATVVDFLRGEGSIANTWSIAGYGDSRPLQVLSGTKPGGAPADPKLSRRIVIRVTNLPKEIPLPTISEAEAKRIKERLEASQKEDENLRAKSLNGEEGSIPKSPEKEVQTRKTNKNLRPSNAPVPSSSSARSEFIDPQPGGARTSDPKKRGQLPLGSDQNAPQGAASGATSQATKPKSGGGVEPAEPSEGNLNPERAASTSSFSDFFDAPAAAPSKKPTGEFKPDKKAADVPKPKLKLKNK